MNTVETCSIQEAADIMGVSYQVARNRWRHGEIEGYQRVKNAPVRLFKESLEKPYLQKPRKESIETVGEEILDPVETEYSNSDQVSIEEVSKTEKRSHAGKKNGWKRIEGRISPEQEAWVEETKEKWGIKKDCDFLNAVFEIAQGAMTMMKYAPMFPGSSDDNNLE